MTRVIAFAAAVILVTAGTVSVPALQSPEQLITAIQSGDVERVQLLLDLGLRADVVVHGPSGSIADPLVEAVRSDNVEIVKLLLDRGARPDVQIFTAEGVVSAVDEALKLEDLEIARLLRDAIVGR